MTEFDDLACRLKVVVKSRRRQLRSWTLRHTAEKTREAEKVDHEIADLAIRLIDACREVRRHELRKHAVLRMAAYELASIGISPRALAPRLAIVVSKLWLFERQAYYHGLLAAAEHLAGISGSEYGDDSPLPPVWSDTDHAETWLDDRLAELDRLMERRKRQNRGATQRCLEQLGPNPPFAGA